MEAGFRVTMYTYVGILSFVGRYEIHPEHHAPVVRLVGPDRRNVVFEFARRRARAAARAFVEIDDHGPFWHDADSCYAVLEIVAPVP